MLNYNQVKTIYDGVLVDARRNANFLREIGRYAGIRMRRTVDERGVGATNQTMDELDDYVQDPTAAIAVNQAGDFLAGVLWGSGDKSVTLRPSRYVRQAVGAAGIERLNEYYQFATEQLLYHMNHSESGFAAALQPYCYDQMAAGTSGVGAYINKQFLSGASDNAITFRCYGVDSVSIGEGDNGRVEVVFTDYWWTASRIINQFSKIEGAVIPERVRRDYDSGKLNNGYHVVHGVLSRDEYKMGAKGKNGAKYVGYWWVSGEQTDFMLVEDYIDKPICIARAIKLRGEIYGRAHGTMLIGAIRGTNFMIGTAFDVMSKMAEPALGIYGNSIIGDSVLQSSAGSMTVFNEQQAGGSQRPVFKMYDTEDPSGIVNFMVPFLNDKISSGFKLDSMLDLNGEGEMTATESLQRFSVRGKQMSGMVTQQKNELMEPIVKRCIGILESVGELGGVPKVMPEAVEMMRTRGMGSVQVPEAILRVMDAGLPWYEIKYNTDLEKAVRTEAVDDLLKIINIIGAIASMYPQIVGAIDWYEMLKNVYDSFDTNLGGLLSFEEFQAAIQAQMEAQAAAAQVEAANKMSQTERNAAHAEKARASIK